ncbi:hypothetical protein QOZ80_9BG0715130 [Eleusine coracana subsp. coracana]|nr:hypothetical protein QOZ80_9BG0715130 [Eleusine coracana subsp. coracana]
MIAHLQSMFWSNSEADVNLSSPNTSSDSCVTASNFTLKSQTVSATNNAIAGEKRMFPMDEQSDKSKNTNKKHRTITQVSRTLSSKALVEKTNTYLANQNSSLCCSSEDDSNGVCDESVALKQSGSSRGRSRSSMNSQSLYAKKRRERINEKLRILQQLIPNGTKVDISTMLEEAVQYVKFLQLQIKLLSSDETWMYAPLAYNGVAIDLGDSANIS